MDLARALTEAADRATADRALPPATALLPRIHRRRALRRGGDAAAGVAAVGVVALAAATLGGGRATPPPATAAPAPSVWAPEATACGARVTPGAAADDGLRLLAALDGPVSDPTLSTQVVNLGDRPERVAAGSEQVLVLEAGRVVARAAGADGGPVAVGSAAGSRAPADLTPCGPGELPDGRYTLVVVATTGLPPDQRTVVGEARDVVVTGGTAGTGAGDRLQDEVAEALRRRVLGASPYLPLCGESADALAATDGSLVLHTSLEPDATARADRSLEDAIAVVLENRTGAPVRAGGSARLTWAAVRDGRVVGLGGSTRDVAVLDVGAGEELFLGLAGVSGVTDCTTGRPETGTYELWVRATVPLGRATEVSGSTDTATLIAPPLRVTG